MNKIFQTICALTFMIFSCFGGIIDYTTIGGGSSTFTGSYSNLNGLPYTITLTNSDGSIVLTPITTNVVGNSSNVVVDISDGPNTNALSASQTQIIGRAITNIVAGPGILVTGTNTVNIGSGVVTNPWPNSLTVTGTVSVANSTYPDQLFIVNPVNGIVDIGDAGFDVHKTFIFVNDNTRTIAVSATNGTTFYGPTTGSFISVGGNTITNNNLADIVGQGNIIADNNITANGALQGSELQLYDNSLSVFQNLLALGGNIKFRGANLTTNSIAASSSTNLLATDSSGNEVAVPWSGLPAGGGSSSLQTFTNILKFGGVDDGVTDNYAAITNAIGGMGTNGGTLYFPRATKGVYLVNSAIWLPPNPRGQNNTVHSSIKFLGDGEGAGFISQAEDYSAGTTLLMLSSNACGKIVGTNFGLFEAQGIQFKDNAGDQTPFIYSTATTLHIHNCLFCGKYLAPLQDCIVLGGTSSQQFTGSTNDAFAGYGTIIKDNLFANIARELLCRTFCNNILFEGNSMANGCAGLDAIELNGNQNGNLILNNIFELQHYTNMVVITNSSSGNTFIGNGIQDAPVSEVIYYIGSQGYNTFMDVDQSGCTNDFGGQYAAYSTMIGYQRLAYQHDPTGQTNWATALAGGAVVSGLTAGKIFGVQLQNVAGFYEEDMGFDGSGMFLGVAGNVPLTIGANASPLNLNALTGVNINSANGPSVTINSASFLGGNVNGNLYTATNGFTSLVSNNVPLASFTISGGNATTFFTNKQPFSVLVGFVGTTITGVGVCPTNGGVTSQFWWWPTSLTGGTVPCRSGASISFTNGITAGSAAWTPFP